MQLLNKARRNRDPTGATVHIGRVSQADTSNAYISPYRSRTVDLLQRLRATADAREAIKLLAKEHPDMSMAVSSYVSLANQGHEMAFYAATAKGSGRRLPALESAWRAFAQRVNSMCGDGMDGLVNQLHSSYHLLGGIAFEVVVTPDGGDVEDVYLIDPASISWKLERRDGRQVYVPYQNQYGKRADLSKANFFWVPCDPDIGRVDGNLALQPAIQAMDHQMELYQSLDTVLYRVGTPRYDIMIDTERVVAEVDEAVRRDRQKLRTFLQSAVEGIRSQFSQIGVKNDFVHTDDCKMDVIGGGANMSGIDARAFKEIADVQVLNATGMLGVLMNRYDSKTNALSSTEFQIMVDKMEKPRRASKRAVEYIASIWARCHGYAAVPVFTHNPIEWESLIDKYSAKLKEQEFYRRAEEYDWVSPDDAASAVMGGAGAQPRPEGAKARLYEYVKKLLSLEGGEQAGDRENAPEEKGGEKEE